MQLAFFLEWKSPAVYRIAGITMFQQLHADFVLFSPLCCSFSTFGKSLLLLVQVILQEEFAGLVTRSDKRSGCDVLEAHAFGARLPFRKFLRRHVLLHWQMALRRLQVLPERHNVHIDCAQVLQRRHYVLLRFSKAQHQRRLRETRPYRLDVLQHFHGLPVRGTSVSYQRSQALHRFDIVRVHIQPRGCHSSHQIQIALKVRRQCFHQDVGLLFLQLLHDLAEMLRSLIFQIVPIDARQNDVVQAPFGDGGRDLLRLFGIQRRRRTRRLDGAKPAATSAGITHDHDRGGGRVVFAAAPALADVGTSRLFADRRQPQLPNCAAQLLVVFRRCRLRLQPLWLGKDLGRPCGSFLALDRLISRHGERIKRIRTLLFIFELMAKGVQAGATAAARWRSAACGCGRDPRNLDCVHLRGEEASLYRRSGELKQVVPHHVGIAGCKQ
mmetsp:Transcript_23260/g.65900  ORF Transcript_23260/g.65900 Transcript_23260/m.65900 type:complete len:440 (+) Transcript_23260:59-1378(+)